MKKLILGIMLLVMLAAMSAPAMGACVVPVATARTETLTSGTLYADGEYDRVGGPLQGGKTSYTIEFTPIPDGATIKWARLYWHIWMPYDDTRATFCNATACAPTKIIDLTDQTNCNQNESEGFYGGGFGTCWVYWNVTHLVTVGVNNVSIDNVAGTGGGDGRSMQCYLVVAYEKTGYPTTTYWVNQGYQDLSPPNSHTTTFAGSADDSTNGTLWQLGLAHNDQVKIWFNTYLAADTSGCGAYGCLEQYDLSASWINAAGGNTMRWEDISDDYHHPALALFMDQKLPEKNLVVSSIKPPEMMRLGTTYTVDVTVENTGNTATGTAFNVSLKVDGGANYSSTVTGVGPLNAGDSAIVSFTGVTLGAGCHEFNATADCDDDVDESTNGDNSMVINHQVGNVIVVKSNSDFERLNTTGDSPLPAGCFVHESDGSYTIKDLTVTNCAGDGIVIENTDVSFVIENCVMHDSGSSGMFLDNTTGGTIAGCTIRDNDNYGVEVGKVSLDDDPELFNITGSTIYENGLDGILLIGYNCTVCSNSIRDNDEYGVYVFANDSRICNNTIESNTKYGMKLYNSSGNRIYWNNFTGNNNSVTPQGWDNRATSNTWNQVNESYPYGTVYTNYTGNYWDDHTTPDAGDGIVDTSYALNGGAGAKDSYSLVTLPWTFDIPIYDGKNLIAIPLYQDDPTLNAVFDIAVTNDKVSRYNNTLGYQSATYYGAAYGWWETPGEKVEPIEPEVGYMYERVGADCTLTVNGTRLCLSTVETWIYNGKNLIGYLNFTPTDLSTFNSPVINDKVSRYNNTLGYQSATYYGAAYGWWETPGETVNPIEVGVGYMYERVGTDFIWTYES